MCAVRQVNRGVVAVWKNYGKPRARQLATLSNSDFFGEASLMAEDSQPTANATVQCMSYCDMLALSQEGCLGDSASYL